MIRKTRSMVVEEPGKMVLREFDLPAIGPEDGLLKVDMAGVCDKMQGALSQNIQSVLPAIELAEARKYPVEKMVTHRFPLEEAEKAVRLVGGEFGGEEAIKVVLIPG